MIAIDDVEWEDEDLKEFTMFVEKFEKSWKPIKKKLELINLGIKQNKKELKISTLITIEEKDGLVSML
jgi:hypothetical protein